MFKISLGNESSSLKNVAVSQVEEMAKFMEISEGFNNEVIKYEVLVSATENLETGLMLVNNINENSNNNRAIAVAKNAIATSMHSIGQDDLAARMNAGTESLTAGIEGITDTLKKMWEKVKEIAIKIWDWIAKLFGMAEKVVSGGGGSTPVGKKLTDLLDEAKALKKDGYSKPAKITDEAAEALSKKYPFLGFKLPDEKEGLGKVQSVNQALTNFMHKNFSINEDTISASCSPEEMVDNLIELTSTFTDGLLTDSEMFRYVGNVMYGPTRERFVDGVVVGYVPCYTDGTELLAAYIGSNVGKIKDDLKQHKNKTYDNPSDSVKVITNLLKGFKIESGYFRALRSHASDLDYNSTAFIKSNMQDVDKLIDSIDKSIEDIDDGAKFLDKEVNIERSNRSKDRKLIAKFRGNLKKEEGETDSDFEIRTTMINLYSNLVKSSTKIKFAVGTIVKGQYGLFTNKFYETDFYEKNIELIKANGSK